MIERFNNVNWHDMELINIEEDTNLHKLQWRVNYDSSSECDGSSFESGVIEFINACCYSVEEGNVIGCPTVIDAKIENGEIMYSSKYKLTFETTAGHRIVYADDFVFHSLAPNQSLKGRM